MLNNNPYYYKQLSVVELKEEEVKSRDHSVKRINETLIKLTELEDIPPPSEQLKQYAKSQMELMKSMLGVQKHGE